VTLPLVRAFSTDLSTIEKGHHRLLFRDLATGQLVREASAIPGNQLAQMRRMVRSTFGGWHSPASAGHHHQPQGLVGAELQLSVR